MKKLCNSFIVQCGIIIFNLNLYFKNRLSNGFKNVVTSFSALVLTFNRILSHPDCVDVLIVSIKPPNPTQIYLFRP